jgi:signal transduction histidine kinase/DNA-binding LacI/PurR family transcriptional regulator/AraC-like DNA-binding protein/ActR/RegA family two-component response regulator
MTATTPEKSLSRRLRIGYIMPRISMPHGLAIWLGMVEAAGLHGVDLLCFAGGEVYHPDAARRLSGKQTTANVLYDLVDRGELAGLVVWGSSLGYYTGPEATFEFCQRFQPLPMISIGVSMPGIPGIVLDSYGGMTAAINHLIEVHGCRRLAFIRGPVTHREARERYRAYCDTLAAHGIPFDPELVSPPYLWVKADGEELLTNGAAAIHLFLEERRVTFDAVVTASDTFALGALPALQAHDIRVPEQVKLVGFDDRAASRAAVPPLTTVQISMQERGRRAVIMLLARLRGEDLPEEVSLPAHLVVRRSCGCFDGSVVAAGQPRDLPNAHPAAVEADLSAAGTRVLAALGEPVDLVPDLVDACLGVVAGRASEAALLLLDAILRRTRDAGRDVGAWQGVISALRQQLLPHVAADRAAAERAERLWHQARVLVAERTWREESRARRDASVQADRLHALSRALALAVDIPELADILARELPGFAVGAAAVALYENARAPADGCRLVLAYDEAGRLDLPTGGEWWATPRLASGGLWGERPDPAPRAMIVQPLHTRDEPLGIIMLDGSRGEGQVYHILQEQVSSALKGVLLLQENVCLYQEACAARAEAQEKQRLAEEADRAKSRFLSMVSHELRTPLILLEGLSEMMLHEGLGSRPLLPEPYRQDVARIRATSQQLGGLVRDVLDLARSQVGQFQLRTQSLDLAAALQPVMLVGEQMAVGKGLGWRIEIEDGLPQVRGDAARLQQVTLNLISNAVKFTAVGEVRLRISTEDDSDPAAAGSGYKRGAGWVTVAVSDTGLGVPLDEQTAIFDEFRQSERTATRGFGGLGVGLAICREIIQLHGGEIGVSSSGLEDGGSTFSYKLRPDASARPVRSSRFSTSGAPSYRVLLLAERAASVARLQAHLLEQGFDAEVLSVMEHEDWLAQVATRRPAAVVLDLQPGSERGWQLLDVLRQTDQTQHIPVLLHSLLAEQEQGGVLALDTLSKPLSLTGLTQALGKLGLADEALETGASILIADDDPGVLVLHTELVRVKFPTSRILLAANGCQVLELLRGGARPLFILLDLMMPELDGIGVLEALQAEKPWRDIPVIILTAQSLYDDDMARLGRGVSTILQKGMFTTAETLAQVERVLERNRRLGSEGQRLVRKVMAYIHAHYSEDITREQLALHVGLSARHLTRCFNQEIGLAPMDYLNRFRVVQARRLLDEGHFNITEVMAATGFNDSSYFSRVFRREAGISPRKYLSQSDKTKSQWYKTPHIPPE